MSCIPNVHLLTSKDAPDAPLQRAGHGQIVETPDGQVYHTHLCSRPLKGLRRSPLGRETAIQKCVWGEDGWLYLAQGGQVPAVDVPAPFRRPEQAAKPRAGPIRSPRTPACRSISSGCGRRIPSASFPFPLAPAGCASIARESIGSWFEQALVARRQEHFAYRAETELDFYLDAFQQAAGLIAYYNRTKFHCLAVGWDEDVGRSLTILSCAGDYPEGRLTFPLEAPDSASAPRGRSASRSPSTRRASSSPTRWTANGGAWGRSSTPRSCRTKRAAASTAPSPARSSAWWRSAPPAAT